MSHPQCLSPAELTRRLEEAGVQPTAQRLAIARFVLCEGDHPTADEVAAGIQSKAHVSRATVYNTLNRLVRCGLLRELKLSHEDCVRYDGNVLPHHHFVDVKTGKVQDLAFDTVHIGNLNALNKQFEIDALSVTIHGRSR